MKNNDILITTIAVSPFSPYCFLANSYPSAQTMESYNDFIYDPEMNSVAVVMRVLNFHYGNRSAKPRTSIFTVSLYDCDCLISSADFSLRMSPWVETENPRIDLSFENTTMHLMHQYDIRVTRKGCKTPIAETHFRFFPESCKAEDSVKVIQSFVMSNNCYRNISLAEHESAQVCFMLENIGLDLENMPEMFINVYDKFGNREMCKAEIERLDGNFFIVKTGIEASAPLFGVIYAELMLFDQKITGFVFATDGDDEEGTYNTDEMRVIYFYSPNDGYAEIEDRKQKQVEAEAEETKAKLESLVGLDCVKSKLRDYADLARFNNMRREASLPYTIPPLHAMFLGAPGTGKTTVAKIMGQLLREAGVLSKGHVVVRERSTLLGQYYNSESERTLEALEEAKGGILFIDEAYQLCQPNDSRDPGKFVIEALLSALADESNRDWMLILAGYTQPMLKMFEMNPGFASRIPQSNIYQFPDYSPIELMEIAQRYFDANQYSLTSEAKKALTKLIANDYSSCDANFGNARHVMNIIQTGIIPAMARRIISTASPSAEALSIIESADIPVPMSPIKHTRQRVGFAAR